MFEWNNRFVFPETWIVDMQSILEFLELIHDFLASSYTVRSSVYIFSVVLVREELPFPSG